MSEKSHTCFPWWFHSDLTFYTSSSTNARVHTHKHTHKQRMTFGYAIFLWFSDEHSLTHSICLSVCDWFILMKSINLINDWVSCLDLKTLPNSGIVRRAENCVLAYSRHRSTHLYLCVCACVRTCVCVCVCVCVFVYEWCGFRESNQRFMM